MKMKNYLIAAILIAASGCSTGNGGGGGGFNWSQSPQFRDDLSGRSILALDTMGARSGLGAAYAAKWSGHAEYAAPEGTSGDLGGYSCHACGVNMCVHAWTQYQGGHRAEFCFAGDPVDRTVDHEWLHGVISAEAEDPPEVLAANNGHPAYITIRGVRYRSVELAPSNIRWPLAVNWMVTGTEAVGRAINWGTDDWSVTNCISGVMEAAP
jgi:hypothetical protein